MFAIVFASALSGPIAYPSGAVVPERLLRLSIVFPNAQNQTVADTVRLRVRRGPEIASPFADPPIWTADRRTLTLILDPSRQKNGLRNHRDFGFVLPANRDVELSVGGRAIKRWRVRAGGCPPPDVRAWHVGPFFAHTRRPLVVAFPAPIDALSRDLVAVADIRGRRISGSTSLSSDERSWFFAPEEPWPTRVSLAIHPRLEDPCGNEIGEPFEHAAGRGLGADRHTTFVALHASRRL